MRRVKWIFAAAFVTGCQSSEPVPLAPGHTAGLSYPGLKRAPDAMPAGGVVQQAGSVEPRRDEPAGSAEEPIDLAAALRLAGVDNPAINLARERVRESLADQLAARSVILPHLAVGGNFRAHNGPLQTSGSTIADVKLQSLDVGFGTGAIGGGTATIPGVRLFAHLGDAAYEPLAAKQRLAARTGESAAVQNQVLLEVAIAYFDLIAAEARFEILKASEAELAAVAKVAKDFADAGQGIRADANRAAVNRDLVARQLAQAEGMRAAASARLARLLNLDPAVRLRTPGGPVEWVRLIDEDADVESLIATATENRPEVAVQSAVIQAARTRVKQEKARPFLPVLSVGFSAGGMSGGRGADDYSAMRARTDFDAFAVWNMQNLGFGNRARVRTADAAVGQAVALYEGTVNRIRREVATAQADAQAASRQITFARSALAAAEDGYKLEGERIRQGQGRPIETLDSFRQLLDARLEFLRSIVAFNAAQFRLFAALGNTPH
ncbi:MAG: TolC family protein [Gemmataceae bacterium]